MHFKCVVGLNLETKIAHSMECAIECAIQIQRTNIYFSKIF